MPSRRPSASGPPDAAPSPAALFAALPDSFQTATVDFTAEPFTRLTYAYPARPPARLDLARLPGPMRQEVAASAKEVWTRPVVGWICPTSASA